MEVFTLTLDDGSVVKIKGPWSSSSSYMNQYFPHGLEITIKEDPSGHRYGGAVLADFIAKHMPDDVRLESREWIGCLMYFVVPAK